MATSMIGAPALTLETTPAFRRLLKQAARRVRQARQQVESFREGTTAHRLASMFAWEVSQQFAGALYFATDPDPDMDALGSDLDGISEDGKLTPACEAQLAAY